MNSLRRAWMFGLALGCGPQPPAMTSSTSATTGEGTTTSTVTTSTSTGVPTEGGSQTTDDSAGSSGTDTGMLFFTPADGGCTANCHCPEDQICVIGAGLDCEIAYCAVPPTGCDATELCSQACATACLAAPALPDGCEEGQPPPERVQCSPDWGGPCSPWAGNCPDGEKCLTDPFGSLCVPIAPQPIAVGDPCEYSSEFDDCVPDALCRGGDVEWGVPVCVLYCLGTAAQPICPEGTGCCFDNRLNIATCTPTCDPFGAPCADGAVCIPGLTGFVCMFDDSGPLGDLHSLCVQPEECDPGLTCVASATVPGCTNPNGRCCTPYCDLGAPTCPPDHTCVSLPWPGDTPLEWAHVGVCAGN